MQHNYKHTLEAQPPAWTIQLMLHTYWNFSSKNERSVELNTGGEEWRLVKVAGNKPEKSRAVQSSWPASMSAELSLLGKPRSMFKALGYWEKKLSSFYHDVFINVICSLYQGKSMNFAFYYHFIDEEMRVYKVKEVGPSKELDWASRDLFNPWFWCQLVTAFENQASIFFFPFKTVLFIHGSVSQVRVRSFGLGCIGCKLQVGLRSTSWVSHALWTSRPCGASPHRDMTRRKKGTPWGKRMSSFHCVAADSTPMIKVSQMVKSTINEMGKHARLTVAVGEWILTEQ